MGNYFHQYLWFGSANASFQYTRLICGARIKAMLNLTEIASIYEQQIRKDVPNKKGQSTHRR